jgi:hypothetical protein
VFHSRLPAVYQTYYPLTTYVPKHPTISYPPTHSHRVFTVYRPDSINFNPDTGATDILIRQQDSTILTDLIYYTNAEPAPAFYVANYTSIYPTSVGRLHIPNTDINLTAYVFPDR